MIIIPQDSQCKTCKHFIGVTGEEPNETVSCAAFSKIPEKVLLNFVNHSQPIEGDNGIQWEPSQQIPAALGDK
jgi:hypothetical protein